VIKRIYATPFNEKTKQPTGPSTDSGFLNLADVVTTMGKPLHEYKRMVIYSPGVVFSDFIFHVDELVTMR